ncbi:MAG TPA: RiPP maturation radical SAM C-methyltransferase [Thermoanaerobaculia bacterium]|jgi:ribosomal peptide maturation radical SAM protein 1|nr:RiPP maturation radical SAM C-methyltransferase [Thermoanaerobaculia bacterium]
MMGPPRVALVHMPFADVAYPSLGLSLLKSLLARDDIACDIHYLNLAFARELDDPLHQEIVRGAPRTFDLAGEWVFAEALWGRDIESDRLYRSQVLDGGSPAHAHYDPPDETLKEFLFRCRGATQPFLDSCLDAVDWSRYRVVGFSSMFQQQLAALALARHVKERNPDAVIVFGGANVEGVMGKTLLDAFGFVDAVCSGEADDSFPRLVRNVLSRQPIGDIPGVLHRTARDLAPAIRVDIGTLPFPDFSDYFEQYNAVEFRATPSLVFETSRGCWWGEKSHCTFCGLNAESMGFRRKTPARSIAEIDHLVKLYGERTQSLILTDNIMPHDYLRDFLPMLSQRPGRLRLFYETKANLQERDIAALARAGVDTIQPGIESLSTPVLKRMRKGTTRLQNIQLLRLCVEYGVHPIWNFLVGFPGESPTDYAALPQLIPLLTHLTPPNGMARVRFDRFSPYFDEAALGVRELVPYPAYAMVYRGLNAKSLATIAYYFDGEFDGKCEVDRYTAPLAREIERWRELHADSRLLALVVGETVVIDDQRPCPMAASAVLSDVEAVLFLRCRAIASDRTLAAAVGGDERLAQQAMKGLIERGLVVGENGHYLSVAQFISSSEFG